MKRLQIQQATGRKRRPAGFRRFPTEGLFTVERWAEILGCSAETVQQEAEKLGIEADPVDAETWWSTLFASQFRDVSASVWTVDGRLHFLSRSEADRAAARLAAIDGRSIEITEALTSNGRLVATVQPRQGGAA